MARYDEEGRKIDAPEHAVGADISELSLDELQERVLLMEQEIVRLKAAIDGKSGSIAAAEAFFKS